MNRQSWKHLLPMIILCWSVTVHPADIIRSLDGDTFEARIPIWLGLVAVERVRLLGVDTPELKGTTKAAGLAAKQFTSDWLARGPVEIEACRRDAFGRVLGKVNRGGDDLGDALLATGHATPYKP